MVVNWQQGHRGQDSFLPFPAPLCHVAFVSLPSQRAGSCTEVSEDTSAETPGAIAKGAAFQLELISPWGSTAAVSSSLPNSDLRAGGLRI